MRRALRLIGRRLDHITQQVLLYLPVIVDIGTVRRRAHLGISDRILRTRRRRRLRLCGRRRQRRQGLLQLFIQRTTLETVHLALECTDA